MALTKNQKRSIIFLLLSMEYGKTQTQIADFLGVSQGTVSAGIKEANYLVQLQEVQQEIDLLRRELTVKIGKPESYIYF